MSISNDKKLKNLLEQWNSGFAATSAWMKTLGVSTQLTQKYLKSGWIEPLGRGAYKKNQDTVEWYGALASIQQQLSLPVHLGGPTALAAHGSVHYVRFGKERVFLFSPLHQKLPKWFQTYDWGNPIEHVTTSFLPENLGITDLNYNGISVRTSSRGRAILESLYLSPKQFDLLECYQMLEGMNNIRPDIVQELLVKCKSVRVKRLFLYMAKKAQLPILKFLNLSKIDLGVGDRSIVKNGIYNAEYKISIPKELIDYV
ncbi:MAG: type IV toxin-antitoxin system AbiEi family antitoxin [Alphaproteobacteria bacterium]|nr:type IV toxin-antitoxin system AbiEi family antitoxin [Alphaproteobacteria bacterium]MCL2504849.1 type IV toxin-antitoxin system AbiEi family antitoxin [Alphaproteobacteria bacterium]